jgi:hypothetical protein
MDEQRDDDGAPAVRAQRDQLALAVQDAAETLARNRVVREQAAQVLAWARRRTPPRDAAPVEPASPVES